MESSSAIEVAKHTLLSGGLILAIGTVTGFVARKIRVPDIALFLVVGIAIGPTVMGLIDIKADSALYQIILLFGASYILFDGGASLRFEVLKKVWITIVALATVGVLITAADNRNRRACCSWCSLDRGASARSDDCIDRPGNVGPYFPTGQNS